MTSHAQTAIDDALAAGDPQKLPFILAGPIVRRAEPDGVWFWFACSAEITACTPQITVYDSKGVINDTLANQKGWIALGKPELRVARLGERLWVGLVKAQPLSRPFTRGWFYGYELTIQSHNFSTTVSGQKLGLAYPPFELPTFMLANDDGQRLMHGSCRRPGATGADAYPAFDVWLKVPQPNPLLPGRTYTPISDLSRRPAGLILTGDQIYADDVAVPLFKAVQRLAREVFGYVERIPTVDGRGTVSVDEFLPPPRAGAAPPTGAVATRKTLTSRGKSPMGFTTDDGEAHLLSFPEFAAMYLLVMNDRLCRDYGVDDGTDPQLKGFPAAVAASRRVLANMVTYMVFDDHEITDDWNLDEAWVKGTTNPMARRVIANGLAAYWAFQGWGNDPSQFEPLKGAITAHLDAMRTARGTPAAQAAAFDRNLYAQHWSFVAPTTPPALCVDTRTSRAFPAGKTAVLSGPNVSPHLRRLAQRHRLRKGAPLLLVLPTPLLDNRIMAKGQAKKYKWPGERYQGDYELYINNPKQRADLIRELRDQLDPPSIIVFSGDVHHGFVVSGLYVGAPTREAIDTAKGTWGIRVNQVTSSPIKNIHTAAFVEKWKGITDPGNLAEEFVSLYQTMYDETQKPVVGVRADVVKLKGNLGRETFVWENHLCVVDIPEVLGGDVKVLFVGNKDGTVKTATAQATTKNDPKLFRPSPATVMKQQPPVFMPMEEEAPEPVALAAVGGPPGRYELTAIEHALGISQAASGTAVMAVPPGPRAPTMYHVVAAFNVPQEHWQTFIDAALEDGLVSRRDEPGTLRFELIRDSKDPNRFYLNEAYASRSSFDEHCRGGAYKKFFATVRPFIDGPHDLVLGNTI